MSRSAFVPDLTPQGHPEIKSFRPKIVFVAESPHVSEIEPEKETERRPLCGVAGRQWWGALSEVLERKASSDVSLKRLLEFCRMHHIAVMNAVQVPLDPKVAKLYPFADPLLVLGFSKEAGAYHYKKLQKSKEVQEALQKLKARLEHPSIAVCPVVCLGNDADWFVRQALGKAQAEIRIHDKIPHPSAWWRREGLFRRIAREKLDKIFVVHDHQEHYA